MTRSEELRADDVGEGRGVFEPDVCENRIEKGPLVREVVLGP